jgi:hypothetical protein
LNPILEVNGVQGKTRQLFTWQPEEFDVSLHGHVPAQVRELHLDQLLWVQRAMPVSDDYKSVGFRMYIKITKTTTKVVRLDQLH